MRRPVVDYREFRLRRINEPRFSHLKLLLGWVFYFSMYLITENLIPAERCHPVHCALDDIIPFHEFFVIPYVFWYALVFFSLLWFVLYNTEGFRRLSTYIIITQVIAMAVYILWPSRQDLRPQVFPRDNLLTQLMAFIYSFDTSTGVCPSLHVAYSLGVASAWIRERSVPAAWKVLVVLTVLLICAAVAFVKQHSVLDVLAALPLCALAEYWAFIRPGRAKRT